METKLLPPASAVRLAWARTTVFSKKTEAGADMLPLLLKQDWEKLWTFTVPTVGETVKLATESETTKEATPTPTKKTVEDGFKTTGTLEAAPVWDLLSGMLAKPTGQGGGEAREPPKVSGQATVERSHKTSDETTVPSPLGKQTERTKKGDETTKATPANVLALPASADEFRYLAGALAAVDGCVRSLETIYKGRELNFKELDKLRDAALEYVKVAQGRGENLREDLRSLLQATPALVLGGLTGASIAIVAGAAILPAAALIVGSTIAVYGVSVGWTWAVTQWKLMDYVRNDFYRNIYFERYLGQVRERLTSLYREVDDLHEMIFKARFPGGSAEDTVKGLLAPLGMGRCKYWEEHMDMQLITPDLWPWCEATMDGGGRRCPYWRAEESGEMSLRYLYHAWRSGRRRSPGPPSPP